MSAPQRARRELSLADGALGGGDGTKHDAAGQRLFVAFPYGGIAFHLISCFGVYFVNNVKSFDLLSGFFFSRALIPYWIYCINHCTSVSLSRLVTV